MTKIDISSYLKDKDLLIFYINNHSDYSLKISDQLTGYLDNFASLNCDLVNIDGADASTNQNFSNFRNGQQGVVITDKNGTVLWSKVEINYKNLAEVLLNFAINYRQDASGKDIFKWGNIIPDFGDYMCLDCGYVLSIEKSGSLLPGMTFPTCEVCQSGEPEGPSTFKDDFWQKI